MDRKRLGWALVALGAVLFVLSAFADPIGLGDGDGIGYKQAIGMLVGGAAAVAGVALTRFKRNDTGSATAAT